ncbi:hypothetical protein BS78_06G018700 [Paspalum vaginatum]|nr:hypothetical protein BS78_06G018700 [Paspalum vaginatum]
MSPSLFAGFTKSLAMTALSEIGDRTFCVAAILAMRHPRKLVLAGCVASSVVMTLVSSSLGWVAPNLDDDDAKKHQKSFLVRFFSPVFIQAFSITFFGEWGDMSQIATIGLAADENPLGVILGGVIAQALCTTAAVLGGKSLASKISEKMVGLLSGALFLVFGIMSLLSGPGSELKYNNAFMNTLVPRICLKSSRSQMSSNLI